MTLLILAALALPPLRAESLALVERDGRLCARDTCLERIPLGREGLDLRGQLSRFETSFTPAFEPRGRAAPTSYAELLAVAGAAGLAAGNRARLLAEFKRLKIRDLAANLAELASGAKADGHPSSPVIEVGFLARVEWTARAAARGVTAVRGHLTVPRDRPFEVNRSFDDINRDLSALVTIAEVSAETPSRAQLIDYVAPATLSNFILALLTPPKHLAATDLETLGRFLQGEDVKP